MSRWLPLLLGLSACYSLDPSLLTVTGQFPNGDFAQSTGPVPVDTSTGATTSTGPTAVVPVLDVWLEGSVVMVQQRDVTGSCEGQWTAVPTPLGHAILFDYIDANSRALADDCLWDFAYAVEGVPTGSWQVGARGERMRIDVP